MTVVVFFAHAFMGATAALLFLMTRVRLERSPYRTALALFASCVYGTLALHPHPAINVLSVVWVIIWANMIRRGGGGGWLKRLRKRISSSMTEVQAAAFRREAKQAA